MLSFHHLDVRLGAHRALDQVVLALPRGWTAVVGPNGAGKSTLLRAAAGLTVPTSGEVRIDDVPIATSTGRERAGRLAWLGQHGEATAELTVRQVVSLGRFAGTGLLGTLDARDDDLIDSAMRETGCLEWQQRHLDQLSGGERQRVFLARVIAADVPWLLLDEPTTHLDPLHQRSLIALLRRLAAAGRGVVTVLHDLSLALLAERLVVLVDGRVRFEGQRDDPQLHVALVDAFAGAVRIERCGERWIALADVEA